MVLFLVLVGALIYRFRGQDHAFKKYFMRPIPQVIFAFPYALIAVFYWFPELGGWAFLLGAFVWGVTSFGVATGHGNGMDLAGSPRGEDERLEFLVKPLYGRINEYWYDALLLAVTGLAVTLPVGIVTLNPVLALSGILKAPAYMIAKFGDTGTDGGELLTGAVLWAALIC